MWCGHCLQPVNGIIDHELCKEAVWFAISEQYTQARDNFKKQYDLSHKGETVEVHQPLTRCKSS
jgi:hypothetical protein